MERIPEGGGADHEASLLAAIAAGDRQGLRLLYEAIAPQLLAVALRIVGERSQAEDVLQTSFLAIWQRAGSYDRRRGPARPWLVRIVRNAAIDSLRRRRRERPLDPGWSEERPDPAVDLERLAMAGEDARALRACLDELEPQPRLSLLLAYWQGLSYEQVATRMAAPVGTGKSWIRRSMMRLRTCLERH